MTKVNSHHSFPWGAQVSERRRPTEMPPFTGLAALQRQGWRRWSLQRTEKPCLGLCGQHTQGCVCAHWAVKDAQGKLELSYSLALWPWASSYTSSLLMREKRTWHSLLNAVVRITCVKIAWENAYGVPGTGLVQRLSEYLVNARMNEWGCE